MKRVVTSFISFFGAIFYKYWQVFAENNRKPTGELIIWCSFTFFCFQNGKFIGFTVIFTKFWQQGGK